MWTSLFFWVGNHGRQNPWESFIASGAICKEKTHMVRVNWPIIDRRLSMTEHFGRSFSNFLHFEWFKNVIGTLSQDLQIIFEMQSQQTGEKWVVKKILFCIVKHDLFHFSSVWPLLLNFLFILNDLKCYRSVAWSFANHLSTLIATFKEFLRVFWELLL